MADKNQNGYERIARELFDKLVDAVWEFDSLEREVGVHTASMSPSDPKFAQLELLQRHAATGRELVAATILDHEDALGKNLSFPWNAVE